MHALKVQRLLVRSVCTQGQRVNMLSVAQESFHQDGARNPLEIPASSEARDGE